MGASAWMQGRAGFGASNALVETGQGFGNYLMALGIIKNRGALCAGLYWEGTCVIRVFNAKPPLEGKGIYKNTLKELILSNQGASFL
ncbi:MAG: hypothetical protein MRJ65_01415 [Candidatus Brocadiaceae bacterium]|nr:hypothetical protein [Candidatus Brocadiaceae bacterium]